MRADFIALAVGLVLLRALPAGAQDHAHQEHGGAKRAIAARYTTHHVGRHEPGFVSLQQRIEYCQAITQALPLKPGSRRRTYGPRCPVW